MSDTDAREETTELPELERCDFCGQFLVGDNIFRDSDDGTVGHGGCQAAKIDRFPAIICGESDTSKSLGFSPQRTGGCGQTVISKEIYRCVDCSIPFHQQCLKRHFGQHAQAAESQRMPPSLSLINLLTNVYQILDVVKQEWGETNAWSEWDQSVRDGISEYLKNYHEGKLTTLTSCKARSANTGANDPQDCDWPFCGCDPAADKVLETLQESGVCLKRNCESQRTQAPSEPIFEFDLEAAAAAETQIVVDAFRGALGTESYELASAVLGSAIKRVAEAYAKSLAGTQAPSEQSVREFLDAYVIEHHGSVAVLFGHGVVCDILKAYAESLAGTQAQAAQWISVEACSCCGCLKGKCIHDDCSVCGGKFVAPVAALERKP